MNPNDTPVIVRGGGDIATGTIYKLVRCGFPVLVLERDTPTAIRRNVAFSEAVFEGNQKVEDMECRLIDFDDEMIQTGWKPGQLSLLIDPEGKAIERLKPEVVVDAILAKKNLGTNLEMAPIVIGLGPGFTAGEDVDYVIETMRGHTLGRIIERGKAIADTGVPGNIGGYTKERVIHSPAAGLFIGESHIGDLVKQGERIAHVKNSDTGEEIPVLATIDGLLRGIIHDGIAVPKGMKIADIDPRESEYKNCFTISDKANAIAGGVVEAIFRGASKPKVYGVVGAGGKTSWIFEQAKVMQSEGKRVMVVTTTHMLREPDTLVDATFEEMKAYLLEHNFLFAGTEVKGDDGTAKIGPLAESEYLALARYCDVVFVEADGARHCPCNYPQEVLPPLPSNLTDLVIVMGTHGRGQTVKAAVHNAKEACFNLGWKMDELIAESHENQLLERYKDRYRQIIGENVCCITIRM